MRKLFDEVSVKKANWNDYGSKKKGKWQMSRKVRRIIKQLVKRLSMSECYE